MVPVPRPIQSRRARDGARGADTPPPHRRGRTGPVLGWFQAIQRRFFGLFCDLPLAPFGPFQAVVRPPTGAGRGLGAHTPRVGGPLVGGMCVLDGVGRM